MKCPSCGREISSYKSCPYCGADAGQAESTQNTAPAPVQKPVQPQSREPQRHSQPIQPPSQEPQKPSQPVQTPSWEPQKTGQPVQPPSWEPQKLSQPVQPPPYQPQPSNAPSAVPYPYILPPRKKGGYLKVGLIVLGVFAGLAIIAGLFGRQDAETSGSPESMPPQSVSSEASVSSETPSSSSEKELPDPSTAKNVSYIDLYQKPDDYKGQFVRIAGKIDSSGKNILGVHYITIEEGLDGNVTGKVYINMAGDPSLACSDGDYVVVVGTVGTYTIGTLTIDDGILETVGSEAESKAMELNHFETREEYIASCESFSYKDIARQPDSFIGKRAQFKGQVVQVQEGYGDSVVMRVDVTKGDYGLWDDTIYVEYERNAPDEPRVLEDDIVILYGELNGIKTYTTVLGSSLSIPQMKVKYISLQES